MAQTKKKRQTKHRGNAAGMVEVRGRTGRPLSPEEKKRQARAQTRADRLTREPSWKIAARNSAGIAVIIFIFLSFTNRHRKHALLSALAVALIVLLFYTPAAYYIERFVWKRRMTKLAAGAAKR